MVSNAARQLAGEQQPQQVPRKRPINNQRFLQVRLDGQNLKDL